MTVVTRIAAPKKRLLDVTCDIMCLIFDVGYQYWFKFLAFMLNLNKVAMLLLKLSIALLFVPL